MRKSAEQNGYSVFNAFILVMPHPPPTCTLVYMYYYYCVVVMPVPVPHNWSGIEILVFGDEDVSLVQILPAPLSEAGGCGDGERALHRGDGCICQPPRV